MTNLFRAYVFRTIADPFAGRINVMKVVSGKIAHRRDGLQLDPRNDGTPRCAARHLGQNARQGRRSARPATSSPSSSSKTRRPATRCATRRSRSSIRRSNIRKPRSPSPSSRNRVPTRTRSPSPCTRSWRKIQSLHFDRDPQTKEFILSGSGQLHIETVVKKLEEPLSRRGHASPAKSSVQGNDHAAGRGAGPSQETVGRTRAVWRLQRSSSSRSNAAPVSNGSTRSLAARFRRISARRSKKASSRPRRAGLSRVIRSSILR